MKSKGIKPKIQFNFDVVEDDVPTLKFAPFNDKKKSIINIIEKKKKKDSSTNVNLF
jgi:hypothetical protein